MCPPHPTGHHDPPAPVVTHGEHSYKPHPSRQGHIHAPSHYPLDPSQLPHETATGQPPILHQPRPLQMERHPSAQEQGEFSLTNVYSVLVCQSLPLHLTIVQLPVG